MRLLLDAMCGGLRSYCRMCGHDAAYALDRDVEDDDRLLAWARDEDRVLVTRDHHLANRAAPDPGSIRLTEKAVPDQLRELAAAGVALTLADPPTRCGRCNGPLEPVEDATGRCEYVPDDADRVWRCRDCDQQFWRGSHWDDVRSTLATVRGVDDAGETTR